MNDVTAGRALRAIRLHQGLRQEDVARKAGVTQQLVSRLELGFAATSTIDVVRRVFAAAGAEYVTTVRWRGAAVDRILDEAHADVVGTVVRMLTARGWTVLTEVTFAHWGERGSVDVLGWHPRSRILLVVEVKTEIASAEEMLRRHDVKTRLGPTLAKERFGSTPAHVARLVVVADRSTNRRRTQRLGSILDGAYPLRGDAVRRWLHDPDGAICGLLFVGETPGRRRPRRGRTHGSEVGDGRLGRPT